MKNTIDIHGTSFDHLRYVIDDRSNVTNTFDFGSIFIGQESVIKAHIVNNSPKPMIFSSLFKKGVLVSS